MDVRLGSDWGQKGNVNRNKISNLQNRMLKRIHFKPNDETVNPLYHKLNILKYLFLMKGDNKTASCND